MKKNIEKEIECILNDFEGKEVLLYKIGFEKAFSICSS